MIIYRSIVCFHFKQQINLYFNINKITKKSTQKTETHLSKLENRVKFNKKVIKENTRKARFIRKLSNKILSKSAKDLQCHQLQKLLYVNCKKMQEKMQSFVNTSCSNPEQNKSKLCRQPRTPCNTNTRKRKRNHSIEEDKDTSTSFIEDANSVIDTTLNSVSNISLNSVYDSDDTDETTNEELELQELEKLEPKDVRVKHTLRKIAKIRKLPDYVCTVFLPLILCKSILFPERNRKHIKHE